MEPNGKAGMMIRKREQIFPVQVRGQLHILLWNLYRARLTSDLSEKLNIDFVSWFQTLRMIEFRIWEKVWYVWKNQND
jgi:hypothetical protein